MNKTFDFQELREYAFGIADPAMLEQLPAGLCIEPLIPRRLTQSVHLMPALIDLRRTPIDRLNALLNVLSGPNENGEPPAIALFIKSDSSATEIARHWNAMQLAQPRLGRTVWLRLHDPRVLHQLLRILNPMQRRKLFGKSQAFSYWVGNDWIAAGIDLNPPSVQPCTYGGVEFYAGPAKWDWVRIERIGLVNRALHRAGIREGTMLTNAGALAEQLMERATGSYGLVDHTDLVEFAARGLKTYPTFDTHPSVAQFIKPDDTSSEQSSLYDRLALIGEDVWSSLGQSTNMPQGS